MAHDGASAEDIDEVVASVIAWSEFERDMTFRLATHLAAVVNQRGVPVFTPREVAARAIAVCNEVLDQLDAQAEAARREDSRAALR